jgi:hypothetical protein
MLDGASSLSVDDVGASPSVHDGVQGPAAPEMRPARLDDYDQIRLLLARYGLETRPVNDWQRFWLENPLYNELQDDWPLGWVLETEERQLVGHVANIPLAYEFKGHRLIAAAAHAWVVADAYRSWSLGLMSRYFGQTRPDLVLITTASRDASRVFDAFRVPRVPTGRFDRANFWITDYPGFARSFLQRRRVQPSRGLIYLLAGGLLLRGAIGRRALSRIGRSAGVSPSGDVTRCTAFDPRFDEFWDELKRRKSEVLLAVRNRGALEWRFGKALADGRVFVFVLERRGRLAAYAIFHRQDYAPIGLKRLRLVDFQTLDETHDALPAMVAAALRSCRAERIHMLETIGFREPTRQQLDNLAPYERTLSGWLFYYKPRHKALRDALSDPEAWDPSLFDGDACL